MHHACMTAVDMQSNPRPTHWASVPEAGLTIGLWFVYACHAVFGRVLYRALMWPVSWYFVAVRPLARRASIDYQQRLGVLAGERWPVERMARGRKTCASLCRCAARQGAGLDRRPRARRNTPRSRSALRSSGRRKSRWRAGRRAFRQPRSTAPNGRVREAIAAAHPCAHAARGTLQPHADARESAERRALAAGHGSRYRDDRAPGGSCRARRLRSDRCRPRAGDQPSDEAAQLVACRGAGAQRRRTVFLGADAPFPIGPWVLAAALGCPVYWLACYQRPADRGRYTLVCELMRERIVLPRKTRDAALREVIGEYVRYLERACREAPLAWFNFFPFWRVPR